MRKGLVLVPLFLAGLVLAQQGPTADELVGKLGHEDFQVREDATKALIEMGDAALPALEKAIHSEDVEVRLRAGRALRAIRGREREKVEEKKAGANPFPPGTRASDIRIDMRDGKVRVKVPVRAEKGEATVKEYEGDSLEELKKNHPELKQLLRGMDFRVGVGKDPFDMDDFWKKWSKDWDDDFMKRWEQETRRDMERMRRWMQMLREQQERMPAPWRGQQPEPVGPVLGVRASRPAAVLDAQLGLRGRGLVVDAVEQGSLAEHLGLRRFDILLELNGKPIRGTGDVVRIMRDHKEGDPATARVVREAREVELKTAR